MNEITIRDLDEMSVQRLKQLAWKNGRPLEVARALIVEAAKAREPDGAEAVFPVPTD